MSRSLWARLKQSTPCLPTSPGDSCGASDSTAGWVSTLLDRRGHVQLHCRTIGGGSQEGLPGFNLGMPAGTSVDKFVDGSLDSTLMAQVSEMVTPTPLQARDIDPQVFSRPGAPALPQIPEDAGVALARRPEIEAVRGRLGAGNFGEVFLCVLRDGGQEVAVKVPHKGSDISQKREVELLGRLRHENLVQLICPLRGPPDALVLELCAGGCLSDVLQGPAAQRSGAADLGLRPRARAVLDVLSAVEYLHMQHIVHRDVKPGNVFLTAVVSVPVVALPPAKLGDLGLARQLDSHMTQCTGTWRYMAPEVLSSNTYAESADVYSCGLLLYEVLSGKVPFDGLSAMRVVHAVTTGQRPNPWDISGPSAIVEALEAVLGACWAERPLDRPSASYLAQCITPLATGV